MPKKNNKIDATFELIDDYDKKKQFFEDTILKLKQFNPPITPDAKTPRTSLRMCNFSTKNKEFHSHQISINQHQEH